MRVITHLRPNSGVLLDANCTPKRCSTASEDQMPRPCKRVGVGNGIMTGSWRKVLIPTARMPRARVVTHFYEFLLVLTIYRNVLRNRLKRQYGSFHLSSGPTGSLYHGKWGEIKQEIRGNCLSLVAGAHFLSSHLNWSTANVIYRMEGNRPTCKEYVT